MSINEIINTKLFAFIVENKCDLSNSNLSSVDLNIFDFNHLKELYLDENLLYQLPEQISKLTNLKVLSLSDNLLEKLPNSICELTQLEYLYLSGNKLQKLPKDIINLKNLRWLTLCDNEHLVLNDEQRQWINLLKAQGCIIIL